MTSDKRIGIEEKLKAAAALDNKVHVIAREGRWAVYKEGSKRASALYTTRQSAVTNAKKILDSGEVDTLVIHQKDGSIFKVETLHPKAV